MQDKKYFYLTTTLPYVNAEPHIGHAMEFIRADVVARHKRSQLGDENVFFNTGTDEHGSKIYEGAAKENLNVQDYVDKYSARFRDFCKLANISYDAFIRTTDDKHVRAATRMWQICYDSGDIYKAKQMIHYCVGCEMEKTDSDLVDGRCPDHPSREIENYEEENYFFRFSKYQDKLLALYERGLVTPETKLNEIREFVRRGLHDFSVSRLKSKMPWGVPVPGDDDHVMYVWFDALTSYIATLDWADNGENFHKFWAGSDSLITQCCGKDNNKSQSAIWQAMLMSAGIRNTDLIAINGHIISGGVKMSKSIGNVISPFQIIEEYKSVTDYSEEVLRFVMCHEVSTVEDSDITLESIRTAYTAYLQNGIGNQVNRILKLSSTYLSAEDIKRILEKSELSKQDEKYISHLDRFEVSEAARLVTSKVKDLDEYIQSSEPFKLVKSADVDVKAKGVEIIRESVLRLLDIGHHLYYIMPRTSMDMYSHISQNRMPEKAMFGRV